MIKYQGEMTTRHEIIEYEIAHAERVKDLLVELQTYLASLDDSKVQNVRERSFTSKISNLVSLRRNQKNHSKGALVGAPFTLLQSES